MTIPSTPTWASDDVTDTASIDGITTTYQNKLQPPPEMQANGLLAGTPLALQHINYQFDTINDNLDYLKDRSIVRVVNEATTSRTYTADDAGKYFRFINVAATAYIFNGGVASIGDKVEIRQWTTGVVTLTGGTGTVDFLCKTGFLPKTSGVGTTIWAIKVEGSGSSEVWECGGELGT